MFGLVKKCVIQIDKVKKVQESPNGTVTIVEEVKQGNQTLKNQYSFGSFKNNNAFKLMQALWKRQKIAGDILKAEEEDILNISGSGEKIEKILIDQAKVEANFFTYETVQTQKQKMVEVQLPCSIQQYYDFFLADNAKVYSRKKHLEFKGGENVVITEWRKNQELNSQVRQISALIKVSGVPFKSQAPLSQVWMIKRPSQNEIYLNVVTQMAQLPYASYFNCQEHIVVKSVQNQANRCILSAQVALIFNKSTYMKNTILTRTFADMKEDYNIWVNNVKQILANMSKKAKAAQQQNDVSKAGKKKHKHIQFEKAEADKDGDLILNKLDASFSEISHSRQEINSQTSKELIKRINKLTQLVYVLIGLNIIIIFYLVLKN